MEQLLDKLIRKGARFSSANDQLKIQLGNISLSKEESEALKANKKEIITYLRGSKISCLSYAQERLWFIAQLGYSEQYHIPKIVKIKGNLDQEALEKTMNFITARHESLRTGFGTVNGTTVQLIAEAAVIGIEQMDLSDLSKGEQDQVCQNIIREFVRRPFKLEKAPLMRVVLIRLEADTHILGICLHHIIFDGWSMGILLREISQAYADYREGKEPELEKLNIHYADYAVWQREVMTEAKLDKDLNYWKEHLAGYEDLDLPGDYPRPGQLSGKGGDVSFRLKSEDARLLKKLCQEKQVTLFIVLMASVYILLRQYSRQKDICMGMPVTNRDQQELENLVGFFVNTLVIRINPVGQGDITGEQLIKKVNEKIAAGQDRRNVPFEKIVETLQPMRDLSRNPFFRVLVNYVKIKGQELQLGESHLEVMDFDYGTSKFDLMFVIAQREDGDVEINTQYSRDLYQEETAARMLGHLVKIMTGLVEEPGKAIDEIEFLAVEEKQRLLREWNDTASEYPRYKCIHELFEQQARNTPGKVALVFEDQTLTYRELDERSNNLAVLLKRQGIKSDGLVGICLERSIELIVGIMGTLKAGSAYVPLEPEYPSARIKYMLEDSNVKVLLTTAKLQVKLKAEVEGNFGQSPGLTLQFINIGTDLTSAVVPPPSTLTSTCRINPVNLVYVIYTSGSTGKPKGIMVEHCSVNRLVINTNYLQISSGDVFLQYAPISFDAATLEIWAPLLNGAKLSAAPAGSLSLADLEDFVEKQQVTIAWLTAPLFQSMVEEKIGFFKTLKTILAGGDVLPADAVKKLAKRYDLLQIINGYGPTENTTFTCCYRVKSNNVQNYQKIPIGVPISNTTCYILDQRLKPVPIGAYGELYTGGDGLARGYLNNPELTSEKFIELEVKVEHFEGTRGLAPLLYRTGDLARWLPDGNIEFLGRIDQQVKVRGFRIECGEIEAELAGHPEVQDVVVIARRMNNMTQLVAYYVASHRDKTLEVSEIRGYLQKTLPDYMIPTAFVSLEEIPLTPNGKVDRKVLLEREVELSGSQAYTAPRTETEKHLAKIWKEVLDVERLGIHDNFFELGGHSLLAIKIISRINKELGVEVPLRNLFEAPSIEGLSGIMAKSNLYQPVPIASIQRPEQLPLSYAQERLWFLAQLGYGEQYHIPLVMKIKENLDEEALQKTMNFIAARHESMRTGFKKVDGRAIQVIAQTLDIGIEQKDLSGLSKEEQNLESQNIIREFVQRPFELEQAPLIRVVLVKLEAVTHILGICLHHIISDGWSMRILTREIRQAYTAYTKGSEPKTAGLKIQYADYAVWQRQVMTEEKLDKELGYWKEHLAAYEDLELPTDYPRPGQLSGKGGRIITRLKQEQVNRLKKLCREKQMTLFTVFMASVYLLLSRYSHQEDICLGMPTANRSPREIEDLIGFFVNTLVIRISTGEQGNITITQLLKKVKKEIVEAQDRQNVPFEKVVESIQPRRDLSRSPIFQVLVNYVNMKREELKLGECQLEGVDFEYEISKFDLTFAFAEREDGGVTINIEYSRDLYREETAARMGRHLVKIMTSLEEEPAKAVDEIELLSEKEKQTLLIEWNNTAAEYPKDQCIHELFEKQVKKTPNKFAVEFEDQKLTYRELDEKSARLVVYLQKQGIKPDSLVGICLERSLEMIVGILGILKAGGAYVPIDPEYPPARIGYMLEDSNSRVLLTTTKIQVKVKAEVEGNPGQPQKFPLQLINIETVLIPPFEPPISTLTSTCQVNPANLAYVIYTSGSTGKPKGVMVEHQNILNTLYALQRRYPVGQDDMYLLKTNYVFDVSITELFGWFMGAGGLVILKPGQEKDPLAMLKVLSGKQVTHINFVPSMFAGFVDMVSKADLEVIETLKYVMVAGEAFPKRLARECQKKFSPAVRIENIYGPTEISIYGTWFSVNEIKDNVPQVPIGTPLYNVQAYVLSQLGSLQPIGVPGELHIGGAGLARGYLNQPELTAEKFINYKSQITNDIYYMSYMSYGAYITKRIYKTGDLARWLPDENIEFLGRMDHQLKIRGFRIECEEIEAELAQHPGIQEAVVIARSMNNNTQLIGFYVTGDQDKSLDANELRNYLEEKLPEYMIPTAFVSLEKIPLTPNGKVNRKALLKQEVELLSSQEYVAPRTKTEKKLVKIWEEVLGTVRVGIHDNFFRLGGHSLLAIQIISRINKEFAVEVPLGKLFETPRLESLSRVIAGSSPYQASAIGSIRRPEQLPLSYAQERLWFLAQLGYSEQYHIPQVMKIKGNLDQEALQRSINFIAARHESLRTGFKTINGKAVQVIKEDAVIEIEKRDLSGLCQKEQNRDCQTIIREFIQRPFQLEKAPLMRVVLIRLEADTHILGMCLHHIIFDGWSMGILTREISQAYAAYTKGKEPELEVLTIQYADYAVWQREVMTEAKLDKELSYWKEHLAGYKDLDLPIDYPRPRQLSGKGGGVISRLEQEQVNRLKKLCREMQMTLFTAFMAGVYLLLRRYSRQQDFCLGTPVANRNHWETEDLIGFFVNTLVIRIDTEEQPEMTVEQLLKKVKEEIVAGQDRQNVPFEKVVETIQPTRDLSRTPIFQVLVNYVNTNREKLQLGESQLEGVDFDYGISKFDLTFAFTEKEDGNVGIYVEYNRDIYQEETAARMSRHLIKIMTGLGEGPGKTADEIDLLTTEEKQKLLKEWNNTAARYPRDKCIHELFEEQVKKVQGNVAVVYENQTLTYRELDERSNKLALYLQKRGITPDSLVGICLERSLEMIVGILGILRAGGAYMPIDPENPRARIRYMLEDSGMKVLLTQHKLERNLSQICYHTSYTSHPSDAAIEMIAIDKHWTECHKEEETLKRKVQSHHLVYGIYTSGSTGKPKGVMVEHQGICNRIIWMQQQYELTQKDRVLQKTPYSFDVSVWEFFWPIMAGARLIFALPDKHKEPEYLAGLIEKEKITTLHFVPSMLRAFLDVDDLSNKGLSIKRIICSGEALSKDLKNNCMAKLDCELHNLYGPTEASVDVSYWMCQKEYPWGVPIGRPIANTQLYILGNNNKPEPVGVPGELHIAGDGLARGYLNQPELTTEKFFSFFNRSYKSYRSYISKKLYKTGDLARWLPDGNIEYLGRIDHQLKVRGFRIELGEIEAGLAGHPNIQEAVVIARSLNNATQLVAYYVAGDREKVLETSEIRGYLHETLPDYMVPVAFVSLEQIPLTPNGKIDRKALLLLEVELESSREYAAPRTETEKQLARIWEEVLGIERVGIYDNFFELGGHSLLAIQIISRINKELGVEVPLRSLFETPHIEGLSRVMAESSPYQLVPIASQQRPAQLPLSYAQERLWFLAQLGYSEQYHVPKILKIKGDLDEKALQKAVKFIAARHESLRTGFRIVAGKPIQVIEEAATVEIEQKDLSGLTKEEQEKDCQTIIREFIQRPFKLEQAPLMRAALIRLEVDSHILGICLHHIIVDGWSIGILTREISQAYAAYREGKEPELEALTIQYADYTLWQRENMTEAELDKELSYWKEHLAGYENLDLPTDYPRPKQLSGKGGHVLYSLDKEQTHQLTRLCQEKQVTLFTVFLASVYLLLRRYSRQEDFCLGVPVANRNHREIENLVGFFVNTLVNRIDTKEKRGITVEQLLIKVKEESLEGQDRQNVPFEKVVESIQPTRDLSRNPIFQVLVNYVNVGREELHLGDSQLEGVDFDYGISKFDLTFVFSDQKNGSIRINLEYSQDLYREETIKRMGSHLVKIMINLVEEPGKDIDKIELLAEAEKQKLLVEWNNTTAQYPKDRCIHELFREQVKKTPHTIAMVFDDQTLSYRELAERGTRLAKVLKKQGVKPDNLVGVCLERSLEMVVGLMGIFKAGGAYVPLDPDYPTERLEYMLRDSEVSLLLTQSGLTDKMSQLTGCNSKTIVLDNEWPGIEKEAEGQETLKPAVQSSHSAYVIYTSGSTGKPKGVMISHQALTNFLITMGNKPGLKSQDKLLAVTTYCFDIAGLELYLPLIKGAQCYICSAEKTKDAEQLKQEIEKIGPTIMQATPATWTMLAHVGWKNEERTKILCGGEALPGTLKQYFIDTNSEAWNMFGPTETTIWSTVKHIKAEEPITIGKSIANTQIYILDNNLESNPIGIPGELWISGDGLARGYLNQPGLTAEKFIDNPFDPGRKLYKTGDLARWLPDGNIDFIGRMDQQVKIRGYRIELGEIESVIRKCQYVKDSIVDIKEIGLDNKMLVAYVIADESIREADTDDTSSLEQINNWELIWDKNYENTDPAQALDFNIEGWISSYSREPIRTEEMQEWVDPTVNNILEFRPQRILEIGTGSGLLLFRIAKHCQEYFATDFSEYSIKYLQDSMQQLDYINKYPVKIILQNQSADNFDGIEEKYFDTIVINSVAQYFPDVDYLLNVIEGALQRCKDGGTIYLGDIRNLALLEEFHLSLILHKTEGSLDIDEVEKRVKESINNEKELVIHPRFFYALQKYYSQISNVEIRYKQSRFDNELTNFRYDVILHVKDQNTNKRLPCIKKNWIIEELSIEKVENIIKTQEIEALEISDIPNPRVKNLIEAKEDLFNKKVDQLEELANKIKLRDGIDPERFKEIGEDKYKVSIYYNGYKKDRYYKVIFIRKDLLKNNTNFVISSHQAEIQECHDRWNEYTNTPLLSQLHNKLIENIKRNIKNYLPEYMHPVHYMLIDEFPLTPNGKTDRKALPAPNTKAAGANYVAPQTETEQQLVEIWQEILGFEKIGIHDDFFELGGHSLLAIQLVAKIQERLGVECPVKNIFDHTTVSELSTLFPALAGIHADNIILGSIPRKNKNLNTPIPLGNSQLMFWFLWMSQKETVNVSVIYDVKNPIDSHHLEQAFNVLLERHESLWVCFHSRKPLQEIIPPEHIPLSIRDLRSLDPREKEENLKNARSEVIGKAFDITSPPLIRLCLIQLEDRQYKLLMVTPHIVADDAVVHTLVEELMDLYLALLSNQPLPPKGTDIHISDFVYWEYEVVKQVHQKEVNYWRQKLEEATFLYVPDSYLLPTGGTTSPYYIKQLDNNLLEELSNLSQKHKVSIQMSLTAVIAIVLHRFTSQNDICIQTIFENRMHQDLKDLVTSLISSVPLRIQLSQGASFTELVTQIKHTTLESYEHSRDTVTIPLWFLYQHLFQGHNQLVFGIKKLTLRFFTWLLTRVWFPHKAYPTMFYAILVYMARKLHLKNKPRSKMRGSKSDNSTPPQGIDVIVNFLPNFYQNLTTSNYISGDVSFSPGKIPGHGETNKAMTSGLANSLLFEFVRIKGEPLLQVTGVRFTPSARQQLTSSFEEVLEAVVKNPQINLLEITNKSSKGAF